MKARIGLATVMVIAFVAMVQSSGLAVTGKTTNSAYWSYDKVVSVDTAESVIRITDAKGKNPRRIVLTSLTQITVNKKPGKLENIKTGMWVDVACGSDTMANRVSVMDPVIDKVSERIQPLMPSTFKTTDASPKQQAHSTYNKVVSVGIGDSTITVLETDGKTVTYSIDPFTKITVYGQPGKLDDIKKEMKVVLSASGAKRAGQIDAMDPPAAKSQVALNSNRGPVSGAVVHRHEKVLSVHPSEFSLIVIRANGENRRTVTVSAFTKIKVYGKPGKLEDIKPNMKVEINCTSGNLATRIDANDAPPEVVDPSVKK